MANIFEKVLLPKVKSSRFDLSHDVKMSFPMGKLIPTCAMEVLPGDKFNISVENFLRFAPLISPVMHRIKVHTHYFFVPTRLLWSNWEKWITGDLDVEAPYYNINAGGQFTEGSVQDYLGLPTEQAQAGLKISPMFQAAYYKIFDEYYRDQNLQQETFVPLIDGQNADLIYRNPQPPLNRAWRHDYFTSALPFAQKGQAVQIPLVQQDDIPVELDLTAADTGVFRNLPGGTVNSGSVTQDVNGKIAVGGFVGAAYDPEGSLNVDVQAGATTIESLRRAFRLQEWLERNARGGTRYIENILSQFDVRSKDHRLQRPEYIGGARQNMVISEVLATAQDETQGVNLGQMAGHGISVGGGNGFNYYATEHGIIMGIISVIPDTAYQQGLHRQFTRFDRLDYAWPVFANVGEQEILLKELYASALQPDKVFGYIPRYSEYRYMNSRVAGAFKGGLAYWHLGRIFQDEPVLNEEFVSCNPDAVDRIFAVTNDNNHIFSHIYNNISVVRKLPRYGIPQI